MENKRAEDRDKLRDLEKTKEEAKILAEANAKLTSTVQELQHQLRETKKEHQEYISQREENDSQAQELAESVELLTLDKEMAEEKCEALQQELDALKEKVEELTLDLEIIRGEKEASGEPGAATTSVEYVQLEKQNERLKEALVKLRDVSNDEKVELSKKLKEAEKVAAEVPGLTTKLEKYKTECREYEDQVANLKEALDGALLAQEVVDRLSDKNLALEDKVQDLKTQLEDLEALQQMNEELEQGHLDTENQLQDEIDFKDNVIRNQTRGLSQAQETIADSENTIIKFRQLVRNLQSSIDQSSRGGAGAAPEEEEAESQAVKSLRQELQTTTMKAQSKAIALELRRLEAEQATEHLGYVLTFLPDKFFQGDHNCIRSTLAFRRIAFKTELIINHLEQTYSVAAGKKGSVDATEAELKFVCEVCGNLFSFAFN